MFSFSKALGGGFRFRTSNPALVMFFGLFMVMWWMLVVTAWLTVACFYWPVVGIVRLARRPRRRQAAAAR